MNSSDRLLLLLLVLTARKVDCSYWSDDDVEGWGQVEPGCLGAWSDDDVEGWGQVEPGCLGANQSPIDITVFSESFFPPFTFRNYGLADTMLENNGHTLDMKVLSEPGLRPEVSGGGLPGIYLLDSFHFHWGAQSDQGAEHLLEGCAFAGELHLVHYKQEYGTLEEALNHPDGVAVLAVWLAEPQTEPGLPSDDDSCYGNARADPCISWGVDGSSSSSSSSSQYTAEDHAAATLRWLGVITPDSHRVQTKRILVFLRQLLPFDIRTFYRYSGSLTTPPYTESVVWTVFHQPVVAPRAFFRGLRLLWDDHGSSDGDTLRTDHQTTDHSYLDNHHSQEDHHQTKRRHLSNNFRPTQPLGRRRVFYSGDVSKWQNLCRAHRKHSDPYLAFPEAVASDSARQEQRHSHLDSSPVNLRVGAARMIQSPRFIWKRLGSCQVVSVTNDGHVLTVRYASGKPRWEMLESNLMECYHLARMVLRWGSDHRLGSLSFPLEVQLIRYNPKNEEETLKRPDDVIVVAKFFQEPLTLWG